ncbi:hypothetical protein BS78_09G184200 [Paspalum vaginatum]|nr:hypothetical protein BS78_09G184200 [Paspalum vaginatum]
MEMDIEEEASPVGGAAVAEDAMSRFSLDASAGGRHSTLLDEYERLAFEAQLKRAIVLRRCYSEPSPARLVLVHHHQQPGGGGGAAAAAAAHATPAPRGWHDDGGGGGRFWRLHEVVARWLDALRPVFRWLRTAWERRRRRREEREDTARRPPPVVPRVQLQDYLR